MSACKTAAAAKSLQPCPTLCHPIDGSPPGSPVPGILQSRTLEWVSISFSNAWKWKLKVKSLSHVWLFTTPWTAAHQAPLSMEFSRQEYWSGVPLPSPWICTAAKSLQSCPTLVRPHRRQPTRLPHPWDSPGKNTGVDCHFLLQGMKVKSESEVAQSCPTLRDPMDCSLPGSSVHGIFQARVLEWGAIAFSMDMYYSAIKKNVLLFAATCIDLENIMLSEMSEKDKYSMISLICRI